MFDNPKINKLYEYESVDDIKIEDCLDYEYKRCMDYWFPEVEYTYDPKNYTGYNTIRFVNEVIERPVLEQKVLEATKIIIEGGKVQFEEKARRDREILLKESDWVSGEDVPQTIKDKWFPYRQALRDLPESEGWPMNITWPTKPV